jgi:di/tricarboxylate transporter
MNLSTIARSVSKLTIILIFFWLISTSTIQDQLLGVVLLAIILWSFYPSRHLESSILIIAILVVLQATLDVEGFISNLFRVYRGSGLWIIISGFILAKGMEVSGLGKRIALAIATSLGAKPRNILLAIAITSFCDLSS